MKKITVLLLAAAISFDTVSLAQQAKRKDIRSRGDTTIVLKSRTAGKGKPEKTPINTHTTGVMGKDTIKQNAKGKQININTNQGKDLPPTDGGLSNK